MSDAPQDAVPPPDEAVRMLVEACALETGEEDRFFAVAPDWFGDRVFGGMVVAHALHAACRTTEPGWEAHSLHAHFLSAVRPGGVELSVERLRDGRTFTTRRVLTEQDGRPAAHAVVSFHRAEQGPEYALGLPEDVPEPAACDAVPPMEAPPPLEVRWIGPTPERPDGTREATRRTWVRAAAALPDDPLTHLLVAAFLSDMTGSSFRPHNLGEWGTHTDASVDHAVWFHRPFRADEWLCSTFQAVASTRGRSTVRGQWWDERGTLMMSMAQELLVRPLGTGSGS